jgi:hypothetical protein
MLADHDRMPSFDLREKLARFDRALADHDRQRREIAYAPWLVMIAGAGIGAALFAAGMAFGSKSLDRDRSPTVTKTALSILC